MEREDTNSRMAVSITDNGQITKSTELGSCIFPMGELSIQESGGMTNTTDGELSTVKMRTGPRMRVNSRMVSGKDEGKCFSKMATSTMDSSEEARSRDVGERSAQMGKWLTSIGRR